MNSIPKFTGQGFCDNNACFQMCVTLFIDKLNGKQRPARSRNQSKHVGIIED